MKIKITLFLLVFFQLMLFFGCSTGPQDSSTFSLKFKHDRGNPLYYNFTVTWDNLEQGHLVLLMIPDNVASSSKEWGMGSISSNSGLVTDNVSFPIDNPSPTTYTLYAELRSSYYPPYDILKTSSIYSVEISFKKFNIIQLAMTGDDLWPNYYANNYYGYKKRDEAFGDANTVINVTKRITNIPSKIFENQQDLFDWTVTKAGGDVNAPGYGLDQNVAIVYGIEDITAYPGPLGLTFFRGERNGETVPARTYTFMQVIRDKGYDDEKTVVLINGTTIHELGHARGIHSDENNINPPHSGADISNCIMWSATLPPTPNPPEQRANLYVPYFCQGHLEFLKNIDW